VEWSGQWGKHMKAAMFRSALKDYQKLNHLPATFQLGRKDRLWKNFHRYLLKFGREQFGFLPKTYILPQDSKQLKQAWDHGEKKGRPWIVKPVCKKSNLKIIHTIWATFHTNVSK
jgi:tubulin polyglutamylase TTLL4